MKEEKTVEVKKTINTSEANEKNDISDSVVMELRKMRFDESLDEENIQKYKNLFSDNQPVSNEKTEKVKDEAIKHLNKKRKRPDENRCHSLMKKEIKHENSQSIKKNLVKSANILSNDKIEKSVTEKFTNQSENHPKTDNKIVIKKSNEHKIIDKKDKTEYENNSSKDKNNIKKNENVKNDLKMEYKSSQLKKDTCKEKSESQFKSNSPIITNSENKSYKIQKDTRISDKIVTTNIVSNSLASSQKIKLNPKIIYKQFNLSAESSNKSIQIKPHEPAHNKTILIAKQVNKNPTIIDKTNQSKQQINQIPNNNTKAVIDNTKILGKKPAIKKKYDKRFSIFEHGDDLQDFICYDEESLNWQAEMVKIKKNLNRNSRRIYNDNDDDIMEAQFSEIEQEENNAMKIAEKEDEMEELRERLFYTKKKKNN